jgi:hypothetical protein
MCEGQKNNVINFQNQRYINIVMPLYVHAQYKMFLNHLQLGVSSASLFKICELLVYMKVRTVIFINRPHTPKRPVN